MKILFKKIAFCLSIFVSLFYIITYFNISLSASNFEENFDIERIIYELFGKSSISNLDYLYNLEEEPIFIYTKFTDGGYCIITKDGGTILEYSLNGMGPYDGTDKKYYCGPTFYFNKISNNIYYNNYNNETVNISEQDKSIISDNLELVIDSLTTNSNIEIANIINNYNANSGNSIPSLDDEGIINANTPSASETVYIDNKQFFISNPGHGYNSTGTCGAVAAQLMLNYHNYYSDRRIISANYLNGGWTNSLGDYDIFNPLNYSDPSKNPNACSNPETMNWYTLGSTGVNETDSGTYFNYLVNKIPASATTSQVKNGIISALNERNLALDDDISFNVESHFGYLSGAVNSNGIKNEIGIANRPVIILMQKYLGGWNHYVVAYGYQNIVSPTNGNTYFGYITHFGHSSERTPNRTNVWINSSWCYSYISMVINHTHNYNVVTNNLFGDNKIEVRCGECGHRKLDDIYTVFGNSIVSLNYQYSDVISIPQQIDGVNITSISENVFKDCSGITEIIMPNTITQIGASAFENCSSLTSVTLSNNLTAIGDSTFKDCTSLTSITIPNSVTNIDSNAFENCSNLSTVNILKETSPITNIGQNVFNGCSNNLEIYVPFNRLFDYKNKVNWIYYLNKMTSIGTFDEVNIDCEISNNMNFNLMNGENQYYKINVGCARSYRISASSNNNVRIKLYNSNMIFMSDDINILDEYLNIGIYYVLFEYDDDISNGMINVSFSLRWLNNFTQINYNSNTNILGNLHNTLYNTKHGKFYYLNNQGEGLYKITLDAGNITYPIHSIKVYTDSSRTSLLDRYNNPEESCNATSQINENVMFVYLPSNGYYYIDISLPNNNYSSVALNIEKAESNNINYLSSLPSTTFDILFEGNTLFSNFEEVTISHKSLIQLDIITSGSITSNIKVVVLQKFKEPGYEPGDNHYYNIVKFEDYITSINRSPVFDIVFDKGTYYIGFIENNNHISINIALRRIVNYSDNMSNTLVADPALNQGFTLGSEVTVNGGLCNSNSITEGFTRCIYLMVENRFTDPMSRLEYDWYSSNDNIASVTPYGTVIAWSVNSDTQVTIYAVLKTDPSIVYTKTFIILNDTRTYETDPLDYYLTMTVEVRENELINLSDLNVPIDMTQYYNWSSSSLLNINYWGYIYAEPTAQGMTFEVVGTYRLNSRVRIHITVYVN